MHELIDNPTIKPNLTKEHSAYSSLSLELSPTGHLRLYEHPDNAEILPTHIALEIREFFSKEGAIGLLRLGLANFDALPASFSFWQQFSRIFIADMCKHSEIINASMPMDELPKLPMELIERWIEQAPFMRGVAYLTSEMAHTQWQRLGHALIEELNAFDGGLERYLSAHHAIWNTVGRVCFHLAENKNNEHMPFAFLATYTTGLSQQTRTQHVPLGRALVNYAGQQKKSQLLSLLLPVQKAAEKSSFLKGLVDSGAIFKSLAWSAHDAYQFLNDVLTFEAAGVMVRVPNWWNTKKPPRPRIEISVGEKNASMMGMDALLDFNLNFALPDGEQLTADEFKQLLRSTDQLIQIKGQWVQVDSDKLTQVLSHWKTIENQVQLEGLSFAEGLRLLAGIQTHASRELPSEEVAAWSTTIEGAWLNQTLEQLRHPNTGDTHAHLLKRYLNAQLRPYQQHGVQWLWWLYTMRLGGCLADDMGLGKTIQVIAFLLLIKHHTHTAETQSAHLLVLPASLLGNWQAELARFAPDLQLWIAHSSASGDMVGAVEDAPDLSTIDLVITTYATLHRLPWISKITWNTVILDEAQAIKNPMAKQTQAIKLLKGQVRFILTGTPIENRLLDLWSLFDFIAPGLLGSSQTFRHYSKQKAKAEDTNNRNGEFYAGVRRLVGPYMLRRLKSDKQIIRDLPDKTEMQTYCTLSKQQASLYQQTVNELATQLKNQVDGIKRRGLVLSYLTRFKQICNHPNQWSGHGEYSPDDSGKFTRLKELCDIIAEKQEKVLVFTQFREIIPALCDFLTDVFGEQGLFLHGQTSIKERAKRVDAFQCEQGPPFFVLSLKAGGTGLNLTAASHVIHFDRWWNPAVENQATDRAYRIGQNKNVLVHKFICRGTIEEKIDRLIHSKKSLVEEIVGEGSEVVLTELSDSELLNIVSLDIHRALGES